VGSLMEERVWVKMYITANVGAGVDPPLQEVAIYRYKIVLQSAQTLHRF
jgi:hypothetical protein